MCLSSVFLGVFHVDGGKDNTRFPKMQILEAVGRVFPFWFRSIPFIFREMKLFQQFSAVLSIFKDAHLVDCNLIEFNQTLTLRNTLFNEKSI